MNKKYKLKIEPEALADIQKIIDWYNNQQKWLGQKFQDAAINQLNDLSHYPHIYAIRYRKIRCALIYQFPYMAHFILTRKMIALKY